MYKILIIVLFFFNLNTSSGKNCNDPELKKILTGTKTFIDQYKPNKALTYVDSIVTLISQKSQNDCDTYFHILLFRGEAYEMTNKFEKALDTYYDILRQTKQTAKWEIIAQTHISISRVFEAIGRSEECKMHLDIAFSLIASHKLNIAHAKYCLRYASYHRIYDNRDSAIYYSRKSIDLGKRYHVPRSVFDGHLLMGIILTEIDSSVFHLRKAMDIFAENGDFHGASAMALSIADRYANANKMDDAKLALHQSKDYIERMPEKSQNYFLRAAGIDQLKSHLFEKSNSLDSAYFYIKSANNNNRQAQAFIDHEKISESSIEFVIENEKVKLKNAERNSYYLIFGLGAVGLLSLILLWSLYKNRKKAKQIIIQNTTINENNVALRESLEKHNILLSEVHHRVKNNLQLVISMITVLSVKLKNEDQKNLLQDVSNKVYSIALIHEQLYKNSDFEKINLEEYINEMAANYQDINNENSIFETDINPKKLTTNIETVLPVGIILTELISNSLKYAKNGDQVLMINIQLKVHDNKYILRYKDNGPGYNGSMHDIEKATMGFSIIQNMIRQLQADATRYNEDGAVFTMVFEEKKVSKI
jgi:two-component system, sensor histidine kinase PdtaS